MLNTEIRIYKTINHGERKDDEQNESNFIIL